MRVAIIIPAIRQLGPVKVVETLVNSLAIYQDLSIYVFYMDKNIDPEIHFNVPVQRIRPRSFPYSDFDIIHTNGIRPDLLAFCFRKRIKYHISTIHNLVFDDLRFSYNRVVSFFFGIFWLFLWHRADKLVCVSETLKDYYKKWFPEKKLQVIYNGVSCSSEVHSYDNNVIESIDKLKSRGFIIIGTAAVLTKRKGIDQILNFISSDSKYASVIIGDGKECKNLMKLSKELKISDRCLFTGFLSQANKYFHLFDIFAMPSRSEGFGLSVLEAIRCGTPVICSDLKIFKELYSHGEVIFFRSENIASFKEAVKNAGDRAIDKLKVPQESIDIKYLPEIMARNYYKLYISA